MAKQRNRTNRPHAGKPGGNVRKPDKPAAPGPSTDDAVRTADEPAGKRTDKPAAKAPPPEPRAKAAKLPPPRTPVFWFGFELPWAKVALARFLVFGVLAVDAFLQISHAPRYGAGDFNAAHLPFLDALGPGRAGFEVGQLLVGYLFALAACGIATRLVLPIAAALYAWLYFGSQLDSYQHHYLVALLTALACFVPWQRPAGASPETPVRSWALRLILVQLGIVYLWAAISKLDASWVDGRVIGRVLTGAVHTVVDRTIGMKAMAIATIAIELLLACTIWLRPGWKLAAPLGILLHLGIAAGSLEIGAFAYLMLALYVLVLPDAFVVWLADAPPLRALRGALHRLTATSGWLWWALAVAAGIALASLVRLEHTLAAGLAATAVAVAIAIRARLAGGRPGAALAAAHLAALALWVFADRASSVAEDYYKFWGGSQRRLGDLAQAERAYRRLVEVSPDLELGHYYLGQILVGSGRGAEGVPHLHEAQRTAPGLARAWMEEARYLAAQGQHADAVAKARQATFAEPSNAEARTLLESLLANRPAPSRSTADDTEQL